jgi:beta-1,4-mannosyltransferase
MRVALFARVNPDLNPYILLYKEALVRQGTAVDLERELGLRWLLARGSICDAIHLHWIEGAYKVPAGRSRYRLVNRLMDNRIAAPLRGALRLASLTLAVAVAKLQGKPFVYTAHNLTANSEESRAFTFLNRTAHRIVLSMADCVHVHNHYTRRALEADYGRSRGVKVIPHGNYIGRYPNQITRREARQQLGLPDDAFIYLFLGLIRPYKGVEELIDAFKQLEGAGCRLLVVGHAPDARYGDRIASLGNGHPAIRVVPQFVADESVQLYMNACNACVFPYQHTTTSGALMLALSFGRPSIVPAIASFPELITPQVGVLYDPSEPDALVSALQRARARSWSEAAILDYAHQFDWERLGPQLVSLYQREQRRHRAIPGSTLPGRGENRL